MPESSYFITNYLNHSKMVCFIFLRRVIFVQKEENGQNIARLACIDRGRTLYYNHKFVCGQIMFLGETRIDELLTHSRREGENECPWKQSKWLRKAKA